MFARFPLFVVLLVLASITSIYADITGLNAHFIANSRNASAVSALFKDTTGKDMNGKVLDFEAVYRGYSGEYQDMKCYVELDMWNKWSHKAAIDRILPIPVKEVKQPNAGFTGFKGSVKLRAGDVLGNFQFTCSFTPIMYSSHFRVVVSAAIGVDKGSTDQQAAVWPFNGIMNKFDLFVADQPQSKTPTVFTLTEPLQPGKIVSIITPDLSSTSALIFFYSLSPVADCSATWDGVDRPNTVKAYVADDGTSIDLKFTLSIQAAKKIVIRCPDVYGFRSLPIVPAIVQTIIPPLGKQYNFALVRSP